MPSSATRIVSLLLLLACGLVVVLGWQNRSLRGERRDWIERATEPHVGMFVPEVPVGALDERPLVLGRGPQVLYFFSTTCPYCEASAPVVQELATALAEIEGAPELIGVCIDGADQVRFYASLHGFQFPVAAVADVRTWSLFRADIVPTVLVINATGRVAYAHVGPVDRTVRDYIVRLQKERKA